MQTVFAKNSEKVHKFRILFLVTFVLMHIFYYVDAAGITDSLIARGNNFYMERQYDQAEQQYYRVLELGYESGDLYYNLGNVCYKQEKLADAILYYEKALLLKPGDEDIKQNLILANSRIVDHIDVIPDFFLKSWMNVIRGLFSADQWAVLAIVLFLLALLSFTLYNLSYGTTVKNVGFSAGFILLMFSGISLALMFARIQNIRKHDTAIIMIPSVNARSSPDEQSTNVFVLHEGTKVMVTDSVQTWKEIRIANGNKGWVTEDALKAI
jgi:tetratricopeptide (TPR) repeat protein